MSDTNFPLPFHQKDLEVLSVEQVSKQLRVSRAFTRLCVAAGCPTQAGRLSAAEVLQWLFAHYNRARKLCGLAMLPEVDGTAPEIAQRLKMANAVITLLEFGESRASDPEEKWQLRKVRRNVEQSLERH